MTSHGKASLGAWVLAALAAAGAAALTPASWLPYRSAITLEDSQWASEESGTALGRDLPPGIVLERDPVARAWKLSASAPSRAQAESALASVVTRLLSLRDERRRRAWGGGPQAGPPPPLPPAGETAVELLAEAELAAEAARALEPAPPVVLPAAAPRQVALRGALAALDAQRARAVAGRDAERLSALLPLTVQGERDWARAWAAPLPGESDPRAGRARAAAVLRVRLLRRALETRHAAEALLRALDAGTRERAERVVGERVRELRWGHLEPGDVLEAGVVQPWVSPARRVEWPRAALALAVGLAMGVLGAALAAGARPARRRPSGHGPRPGVPATAPAESAFPAISTSALHWVSGATPACVTGAVYALAARAVARGERVLVVDASEKLSLHRVVEREHRWGLAECIREGLPVLGLVQETGVEGLYLLARGIPGPRLDWEGVARILHLARPHFVRIVLGLDPGAHAGGLRELAGLGAAGWWARRSLGAPGAPKRVAALAGNSLHVIKVDVLPKVSLEECRAALESRQARDVPERAASRRWPAAPPTPAPILDCDLQVQERLRFLAWVRQVATGKTAGAARPAPDEEPAHTPA